MVEITIIARNVCGINFRRFVNFHRFFADSMQIPHVEVSSWKVFENKS